MGTPDSIVTLCEDICHNGDTGRQCLVSVGASLLVIFTLTLEVITLTPSEAMHINTILVVMECSQFYKDWHFVFSITDQSHMGAGIS
jgi:hypothetical protein